jgi:hypothetical protein
MALVTGTTTSLMTTIATITCTTGAPTIQDDDDFPHPRSNRSAAWRVGVRQLAALAESELV